MTTRELILSAVGVLALAAFLVVAVASCTSMQTHNQRNRRDVQLTCLQQGKQWIAGNCIAVPKGP